MLPTLGLLSATIGLLIIIFMVYQAQKHEAAKAERNMLVLVSVVAVVVAAWHIGGAGMGGGGH
jgi:membrane-associated HD superfamily phosphohydrolase